MNPSHSAVRQPGEPSPQTIAITTLAVGLTGIAAGFLGILILLYSLTDRPDIMVDALLMLLFALSGRILLFLPCVTLAALGAMFIVRPTVWRLESIIALLTFSAGFGLVAAVMRHYDRLQEPAALPVAVFSASLILLPVNVVIRVKCSALTGLRRLNPWMTVGGGWIAILAVEMWLVMFKVYSVLWGFNSRGSSERPDLDDYFPLFAIVLPLFAACAFIGLSAWWLSKKAKAWDARHPKPQSTPAS